MSVDDLNDTVAEALKSGKNRWTAIYIAVLAVLIAVCAMGGNNADKTAMANNISTANTYAFFQAKNIRLTSYTLARDELLLRLAGAPDMPQALRDQIQKKINAYTRKIKKYRSEAETGEGKKELLIKARYYEKLRDDALARDPYFDFGQALLQVAIVLASVSLISGGLTMLVLSVLAMILGVGLTANGFFLFTNIPLYIKPWLAAFGV